MGIYVVSGQSATALAHPRPQRYTPRGRAVADMPEPAPLAFSRCAGSVAHTPEHPPPNVPHGGGSRRFGVRLTTAHRWATSSALLPAKSTDQSPVPVGHAHDRAAAPSRSIRYGGRDILRGRPA